MSPRTARLGDICEINPRAPKSLQDDARVSFLSMAAVSEDGFINEEQERAAGEVRKGYSFFGRGDVLVAKITPCFENGKATRTSSLLHPIGFGSTEFHVLRASNDVLPDYIFHTVWNTSFREVGTKNMTGSAGQKRVPTDFIRRLEIPLPPLEEQRRIAAILDKADALRRKRKRALELLDGLTQSIFLEMFGDIARGGDTIKRKAGFNTCDWHEGVIGDQIVLKRGKDITKAQAIYGDIPVISSGGISFYHNEKFASGPGVLLGRKGSVGNVHFTDTDFWPHDTTLYVRDFRGNLPEFVYCYFKNFPIERYEASAANPSLNRNNIHPVKTLWPKSNLQERFSLQLRKVWLGMTNATAQLVNSEALFASLQQRAFAGQL